jgi:hypothetical protein
VKFDMVRPCKGCPFRTDRAGYLHPARAKEIAKALVSEGRTFACHKTTVPGTDDDGEEDLVTTANSQHCAGALLMLEHMGVAFHNQMVRIAERLQLYDHRKMDMAAPVVHSDREFRILHGGKR